MHHMVYCYMQSVHKAQDPTLYTSWHLKPQAASFKAGVSKLETFRAGGWWRMTVAKARKVHYSANEVWFRSARLMSSLSQPIKSIEGRETSATTVWLPYSFCYGLICQMVSRVSSCSKLLLKQFIAAVLLRNMCEFSMQVLLVFKQKLTMSTSNQQAGLNCRIGHVLFSTVP